MARITGLAGRSLESFTRVEECLGITCRLAYETSLIPVFCTIRIECFKEWLFMSAQTMEASNHIQEIQAAL